RFRIPSVQRVRQHGAPVAARRRSRGGPLDRRPPDRRVRGRGDRRGWGRGGRRCGVWPAARTVGFMLIEEYLERLDRRIAEERRSGGVRQPTLTEIQQM